MVARALIAHESSAVRGRARLAQKSLTNLMITSSPASPGRRRMVRVVSGDPLRLLWDALEAHGCEPHGAEYQFRARCPAHDGDNGSALSVRMGADGRAVLYCHAHQCSAEAITASLGLQVCDLFPDGHHRGRRYPLRLVARSDFDGLGSHARQRPRRARSDRRAVARASHLRVPATAATPARGCGRPATTSTSTARTAARRVSSSRRCSAYSPTRRRHERRPSTRSKPRLIPHPSRTSRTPGQTSAEAQQRKRVPMSGRPPGQHPDKRRRSPSRRTSSALFLRGSTACRGGG